MQPEIRISYSIDTTSPAIAISAPAQGATYTQGQTIDAAYSCSDDGVGVAKCTGPVPAGQPLDTSTAGTHTFTVTATDNTGNESSQTVTYDVQASASPPVSFVTPDPPSSPNPPVSANPQAGQDSPAGAGRSTAPSAPAARPRPHHGQAPTSPPAFTNTVAPVISGSRLVGHMLQASPGNWSRHARVHYQWKRCTAAGTRCRTVARATARTYRLTGADIGHKVSVTVIVIDTQGRRVSVTARPIGPVARRAHPRGRRR
jgi:hypothetical protein